MPMMAPPGVRGIDRGAAASSTLVPRRSRPAPMVACLAVLACVLLAAAPERAAAEWLAPLQLSSDGAAGMGGAMALGPDGTATAIFAEKIGGEARMVLAHRSPGAAWEYQRFPVDARGTGPKV